MGQIWPQYLSQCCRGEHVLLKSFTTFSKSPLNRICFLHNFAKIFEVQNLKNGLDYYQLLRLMCSDFPKDIVSKASSAITGESGLHLSLSPAKFIHACFLFLVFSEYVEVLSLKLFEGSLEKMLPFLQIYVFIAEQDKKIIKIFEKPPFGIMVQILLDIIQKRKHKGNFAKKITFVT